MKAKFLFCLIICLGSFKVLQGQFPYPGNNPGEAMIRAAAGKIITLENKSVSMQIAIIDGSIRIAGFEDREKGYNLLKESLPLFEVKLKNGQVITSDNFRLKGKPLSGKIEADPSAAIYAERVAGVRYGAYLEDKKSGLSLHWEAVLRNGSNYVRQIFRFKAADEEKISAITLVRLQSSTGVVKIGNVDGSPLVVKNFFIAVEYPLARLENEGGFSKISVPRLTKEVSSVWGVTPSGQLRRGFLYYVERERAHPYHQVLHYNSWFDISWGNRKFNESESIDRIRDRKSVV